MESEQTETPQEEQGGSRLCRLSWKGDVNLSIKDGSKLYSGLMSNKDRTLECKFIFPNLISFFFFPVLKHQIRAYLTFWRICCAGIDIPHCLRVKNKMDKNYFKPHGLAVQADLQIVSRHITIAQNSQATQEEAD